MRRRVCVVSLIVVFFSTIPLFAQPSATTSLLAVNKARTFIEGGDRGSTVMSMVHPAATYRGMRFLGTRDLDQGQFQLVYKFNWDQGSQTEIGFNCDSRGNVQGVRIGRDSSDYPAFAGASLIIGIAGQALLNNYKDQMSPADRRFVQQAIDNLDARTFLEIMLALEQASGN